MRYMVEGFTRFQRALHQPLYRTSVRFSALYPFDGVLYIGRIKTMRPRCPGAGRVGVAEINRHGAERPIHFIGRGDGGEDWREVGPVVATAPKSN